MGQDGQRQDRRGLRIQHLRRRAMIIGGPGRWPRDYFKKPCVSKPSPGKRRITTTKRDLVKQGQTTKLLCADILQNADSETAFGFTASLMALYDVTGDKVWLEKSRNAANLAATWVVSYDYELPTFTALGAIGTKFAGAVWASTQNKHAAPGACTTSCDPLMKLLPRHRRHALRGTHARHRSSRTMKPSMAAAAVSASPTATPTVAAKILPAPTAGPRPTAP